MDRQQGHDRERHGQWQRVLAAARVYTYSSSEVRESTTTHHTLHTCPVRPPSPARAAGPPTCGATRPGKSKWCLRSHAAGAGNAPYHHLGCQQQHLSQYASHSLDYGLLLSMACQYKQLTQSKTYGTRLRQHRVTISMRATRQTSSTCDIL
uniref:Uncharacterized protein n=1 Tax=Haptolina ericina TaxID=156174 RepID=A0A7S3BR78_9EUKA